MMVHLLDDITLETIPYRCGYTNSLLRGGNDTTRRRHITSVRSLPYDLLNNRVAMRDDVTNSADSIWERLLPRLNQLHIFLSRVGLTSCTRFLIMDICGERCTELCPITVTEGRDDCLGDVRHVLALSCGHDIPPHCVKIRPNAAQYPNSSS